MRCCAILPVAPVMRIVMLVSDIREGDLPAALRCGFSLSRREAGFLKNSANIALEMMQSLPAAASRVLDTRRAHRSKLVATDSNPFRHVQARSYGRVAFVWTAHEWAGAAGKEHTGPLPAS